jgi:MoaA/NifB/PqqE/SkfB family radical SAM enzyme
LNGAVNAPRIISWNITLRCPLKCSHCYVDTGDKEAGLRCGVRVTLTKGNQHGLADLVDLPLSLGASRLCLYWLVLTGRGSDSYARLQLDQTGVVEALDVLYRKAKETDPGSMEFLTFDAQQDCIHLL